MCAQTETILNIMSPPWNILFLNLKPRQETQLDETERDVTFG